MSSGDQGSVGGIEYERYRMTSEFDQKKQATMNIWVAAAVGDADAGTGADD